MPARAFMFSTDRKIMKNIQLLKFKNNPAAANLKLQITNQKSEISRACPSPCVVPAPTPANCAKPASVFNIPSQ